MVEYLPSLQEIQSPAPQKELKKKKKIKCAICTGGAGNCFETLLL